MENSRLREAASTSVNVTVGKRSREYLTDREVERLIEAAKQNRSGHRSSRTPLTPHSHFLQASQWVCLWRADSCGAEALPEIVSSRTSLESHFSTAGAPLSRARGFAVWGYCPSWLFSTSSTCRLTASRLNEAGACIGG
jgi:hypothetical protein